CLPIPPSPGHTTRSTLSLHDALPIWPKSISCTVKREKFSVMLGGRNASAPMAAKSTWEYCAPTDPRQLSRRVCTSSIRASAPLRSEEHTSELQSRENLVCRLLLEKKK